MGEKVIFKNDRSILGPELYILYISDVSRTPGTQLAIPLQGARTWCTGGWRWLSMD